MTALKLVLYFIVLIAILCLAYYTTKLVGNGMGRKQDSGGIRVLERTVIARDSFLLIVEIQGTVMVLGVSTAGIQKICDLESYAPPKNTQSTSFSSVFAGQLRERMSGEKDGQGRGRRDER